MRLSKTGSSLFAAIVFVEFIALIFYNIYYSDMWIQNREQNFKVNSMQQFTASLQMKANKTFAFGENSSELTLLKNIRSHCSQLTFSFVSPVIQPRFDEKDLTSIFLLVLTVSGAGKLNRERRYVIRKTWANKTRHHASRLWKHIFVLGKTHDSELDKEIMQESSVFNDVLVLDVAENYDNLVIKTFSGLLWGLVHVNPRLLLKTDDDVYIRIPYLITWLELYATELFYGGFSIGDAQVRRSASQKNYVTKDCLDIQYYPPYCSGPFYVVSASALRSIFQSMKKWKAILAEDAYMGILAHESGLPAVDIPGFNPFRSLQDYGKCHWSSAVALGHSFDFLEFSYVENKLQEYSDLPRYYYQCVMTDWAAFIFLFFIPSFVFVTFLTVVKVRTLQTRRLF